MPKDMVKLTYNGREIEAEAGKPIIHLSQDLGEEIPHFCYHPGLGNDGNCRMCLVELAGVPKLVLACTLAAAEGMSITTNSEKVIKAREGVLEFILVNHPLDCAICDKGGECPLQENTRKHGPGHSRMADGKNLSFKHKTIGEHIVFDDERCIRCSRCIRFQRDVVGREELGFVGRGDHIVIGLFGDQQLTSGFTGNLADICPVGALTSKDFRFKARPWEMQSAATACGGCSLHCSATAWWKKDEMLRITAGVDHDVNDWWICDKGRYGYGEEDPVQGCLMRRQGEQVPLSYFEASQGALAMLEGAEGAAVLAGSRCTDEEYAALARLQERLDPGISPFPLPAELAAGVGKIERAGAALDSLSNLSAFERVLVLGCDPELSHPVFALRLGQSGHAAGGSQSVTLVHDGDFAPISDFSRRWTRAAGDPVAWLAANADGSAGSGSLLVVLHEGLLRGVGVDAACLDAWLRRVDETKILVLHDGLNRRGLIRAAAPLANKVPLLEALEGGSVSTLLVFGLDPELDFDDAERWERALGRAGRLIVQSARPASLQASAELVLARRRGIDLDGSITGSLGRGKSLRTWKPRAGRRALDTDWFAPLLESVEVAGRHEG